MTHYSNETYDPGDEEEHHADDQQVNPSAARFDQVLQESVFWQPPKSHSHRETSSNLRKSNRL